VLTQGTAIFSLMRNIGSSIGIAILEALFVQNTQIVHSRLVEPLRPDNPLAHAPYLVAPYSLSTANGVAALNAEVTRQAQMVAYIDDFKLMNLNTAVAGGLPAAALLLLILDSDVRRAVGSAAAAVFVLEDTFAAPD
jgi:hypothetical protein